MFKKLIVIFSLILFCSGCEDKPEVKYDGGNIVSVETVISGTGANSHQYTVIVTNNNRLVVSGFADCVVGQKCEYSNNYVYINGWRFFRQ